MRSPPARLVVATLAAIVGAAHIGSPDVWFEGAAGPYRLLTVVRMPKTTPGPAEITVDVRDGAVSRVLLQPLDGTGGRRNPPAEAMRLVGARSFAARLWWMTAGSHAVRVVVEGDLGRGEVLVPVTAVDGRREPFPLALGALLGGLLALLFVGGIAMSAAAAREGSLPPGASPPAARDHLARRAGVVTALAIAAGLCILGAWWNAADQGFAARAYRPPPLDASVVSEGDRTILRLTIGGVFPLVAEHGRLMHLFLVREPEHGAFAHLHPATRDSITFETKLPAIPAGRYRVYAEVVRGDGFPETMTTTVTLPPRRAMPPPDPAGSVDPDDAWYVAESARPAAQARRAVANDGTILVWEGEERALRAGEDAGLTFAIFDPEGRPALLEPYLGMAGHAVVVREDGGVFAHLHPMGTISMAARSAWAESGGAPPPHRTSSAHEVTFPYGFPTPGAYRVFVQVRRDSRVVTAAFRARVEPGP